MAIPRKRKFPLSNCPISRIIQPLINKRCYAFLPLDADILKVADSLDVDMEMHDKLIVATTLHY